MRDQKITFANELGEVLGPLLEIVRSTGFFEAYVFLPLMTVTAMFLFIWFNRVLKRNGRFDVGIRSRLKILFQAAYFSMWFIATNSTAVAFKTLIVEEMDYETPVWFLHLVGPLHFYITSVALIFLWVVWRNRTKLIDRIACLYVQVGLLAGYYAAFYRLTNEALEFTDPTTGISGILFFIWFGFLNWDIVMRFFAGTQMNNHTTAGITKT